MPALEGLDNHVEDDPHDSLSVISHGEWSQACGSSLDSQARSRSISSNGEVTSAALWWSACTKSLKRLLPMSSAGWLLAGQTMSSGQKVAPDKSWVRGCFLRIAWTLSLCLNSERFLLKRLKRWNMKGKWTLNCLKTDGYINVILFPTPNWNKALRINGTLW